MPNAFHVLLIDDNHADLLLAAEAFQERDETVRISSHIDGRDALAFLRGLAREDLPHVIILDLNMPVMDGLEVLRQLKQDGVLQLIPVVMLSTSADPMDIERAYSLHASSYLVKAPDFREFVEQVDHFLLYWRQTKLPHKSGRRGR